MLASHGEVLSKRYTDSRVIVHCRVPERALSHLRGEQTTIRPHGQSKDAAASNGHAEDNGHAADGNGDGKSEEFPNRQL